LVAGLVRDFSGREERHAHSDSGANRDGWTDFELISELKGDKFEPESGIRVEVSIIRISLVIADTTGDPDFWRIEEEGPGDRDIIPDGGIEAGSVESVGGRDDRRLFGR
jgi:hypothetical protein